MLNQISIIGRLVKDPKIINSTSPALYFIIANNYYNNTFYFDVFIKRNISFHLDNLKKGYQVAIEGNIVQTKSRKNIVVLAAQVHIINIPDTGEKQMSLIPDSYFDELEKVNMNRNQIKLTPEQKKEVQEIKNASSNW